jgi:DNA repair exonuclease SbcCD ATPase subunit
MLKITNLTLKNFLSIGNATQAVRLDQHGVTLILGSNADATGGITRNGAGKTAILQAVSFALYGKPLTKIKADNLINNINTKGMFVTIEFERGDTVYRVERGRKPNLLRFFVNDKERLFDDEDLSQGENRRTQEEIERALGMSHTMFSYILALNTYTDPFLTMKAADQRAVMEELIGAMQLTARAEVLKRGISATKERLRDLEARTKATTEANDRLTQTIRQTEIASTRWEQKQATEIARLLADLQALEGIDFEAEVLAFDALDAYNDKSRIFRESLVFYGERAQRAQDDLTRAQRDISRLEAEVARIDPAAAVRRLDTEIKRKEADIERHALQEAKLREELRLIQADIDNPDAHQCRSCGQGLSGTDHLATVIANLTRQADGLRLKIDREVREAAARADEVEPIRAEIAGTAERAEADRARLADMAEEAQKRAQEAQDALAAAMDQYEGAEHCLADLGEAPATTFASRDQMYEAKGLREGLDKELAAERARENPYIEQIAGLKEAIQVIDPQPLEDTKDLLKHQEFLLKLLTNKDSFIRKKIVDQNLGYLNARMLHYLERLGLPHAVKFQPDLSVEISYLGRDFDFAQLSRGEMNRVIMATSWSFRDVWESLNESVNLYFIDEVLDQGTCSFGAEASLGVLMSMARERGKNVFLISHRDELVGRIDRTLLVRRENNFSNFEEDVVS